MRRLLLLWCMISVTWTESLTGFDRVRPSFLWTAPKSACCAEWPVGESQKADSGAFPTWLLGPHANINEPCPLRLRGGEKWEKLSGERWRSLDECADDRPAKQASPAKKSNKVHAQPKPKPKPKQGLKSKDRHPKQAGKSVSRTKRTSTSRRKGSVLGPGARQGKSGGGGRSARSGVRKMNGKFAQSGVRKRKGNLAKSGVRRIRKSKLKGSKRSEEVEERDLENGGLFVKHRVKGGVTIAPVASYLRRKVREQRLCTAVEPNSSWYTQKLALTTQSVVEWKQRMSNPNAPPVLETTVAKIEPRALNLPKRPPKKRNYGMGHGHGKPAKDERKDRLVNRLWKSIDHELDQHKDRSVLARPKLAYTLPYFQQMERLGRSLSLSPTECLIRLAPTPSPFPLPGPLPCLLPNASSSSHSVPAERPPYSSRIAATECLMTLAPLTLQPPRMRHRCRLSPAAGVPPPQVGTGQRHARRGPQAGRGA